MWLEEDYSKDVDIDQIVSEFTKDEQLLSRMIKKMVANSFKNGFEKTPTLKGIDIKFPFSNNLKVSFIIDNNVDLTDYRSNNIPKEYLCSVAFLSGYFSEQKKLTHHLYGMVGKSLMISDKNAVEIKEIEKENLSEIQFLGIKTESIFQKLTDFDNKKDLSSHENMRQFVLLVNLKKTLLSLKLIESIFATEKDTKIINFSLTNGKIRIFTNKRKNSEQTKQKIDFLKLIMESLYSNTLKIERISIEKEMPLFDKAELFLTKIYNITYDTDLMDHIKKTFNIYCISEEHKMLSEIIKKENINVSNTTTHKRRI